MDAPRLTAIEETRFVGMRLEMSFSHNRTSELWGTFMPRIKEIVNRKTHWLYSLQWYGQNFDFAPGSPFEKWALVPVTDFASIPEGMEPFVLPAGHYAVFNYKGVAGNPAAFQYIFSEWLPGSGYMLEDRPHFEVLGAGYHHHSADSEEEIWIPVGPKSPNLGK